MTDAIITTPALAAILKTQKKFVMTEKKNHTQLFDVTPISKVVTNAVLK